MGLADAQSAEHGVASENLIVAPVACPLPNRAEGAPKLSGSDTIRLQPGTLAFRIYQREEVTEEYFCNYELNPAYQPRMEAAGLRISGFGPNGEGHVAELPTHPFFFVSLFQPPLSSAPGHPHPVVIHYLRAAARFADGQSDA
jgi:CTP synthase (UTP-ammonia lyase)